MYPCWWGLLINEKKYLLKKQEHKFPFHSVTKSQFFGWYKITSMGSPMRIEFTTR